MSARLKFVLYVLVVALAAGCSKRPKAPPLVNDTIFQNDKIGLRFLAPDGWSIASRADLPAELPKPIVLIAYQLNKGESSSELEVLAADVPDGTDLGAFLVENRIGAAAWTLASAQEPVSINGADATRFLLTRKTGKSEIHREVTAFRRGGRIYFFIITFATSDSASRDAARQSVQSATWSK